MNKRTSASVIVAAALGTLVALNAGCEKEQNVPASVPASGAGGASATATPAPADADATKAAPVQPEAAPGTPPGPAAAGSGKQIVAAGLVFPAADGWEVKPGSNSMRVAEVAIPAKEGDAGAMIIFFYFGAGQGGNVQQNIDRWKGMVTDAAGTPSAAEAKTRTVNGMNVTTIAMEGTYHEGMPGAAKTERPDYGFVGAVVEGPQGAVFARLVGPKAAVTAATADFEKMLDGVRVQ